MPGGINGSANYIRQDSAAQIFIIAMPLEVQGAITGTIGSGINKARGEVPTGAVDGSNRTFTLAQAPTLDTGGVRSTLAVYSDNIRVNPTQYTIVGVTLTFNVGSLYIPNTEILCDYDY